tara:strand:- start:930 stop:1442 length:513 start_codon:yes stop_codon:yes gene_type:complete
MNSLGFSEVSISDSFMKDSDCDFLKNYFEEYYVNKSNVWGGTNVISLSDTPSSHLKKSFIRKKHLWKISRKFPFLKYQYDNLVKWLPGSFSENHYDRDFPHSKVRTVNDWTAVCYLNDDYEGGELLLENKPFKPKKGRLIVFPGKKIFHSVKEVHGNRYTHIAWWQELKN